jgi:ABC-type xylose transport system substrate-binding protein
VIAIQFFFKDTARSDLILKGAGRVLHEEMDKGDIKILRGQDIKKSR